MRFGSKLTAKRKINSYLFEIGKWALVIWLLLPMRMAMQGTVEFARVGLGVILFVIFIGKLLYDVTYFPRRHQRETTPGKDLISMIGIVSGIAVLVLLLVFFVAMYVISYMSSANMTK
jgi:predicted ABC-type exoprotein transport system permease subunit